MLALYLYLHLYHAQLAADQRDSIKIMYCNNSFVWSHLKIFLDSKNIFSTKLQGILFFTFLISDLFSLGAH
jgi:hypothetical protein